MRDGDGGPGERLHAGHFDTHARSSEYAMDTQSLYTPTCVLYGPMNAIWGSRRRDLPGLPSLPSSPRGTHDRCTPLPPLGLRLSAEMCHPTNYYFAVGGYVWGIGVYVLSARRGGGALFCSWLGCVVTLANTMWVWSSPCTVAMGRRTPCLHSPCRKHPSQSVVRPWMGMRKPLG